MSYRVGVKIRGEYDWVFNALRFARMEDAEAYANDLYRRWTAVTDYIVEPSQDEANATFPVPSDRYIVMRGVRGPP